MEDKVSIVTVSYNQGHFIEKTINSVISQDYKNIEYIIIDGGSTDNSTEIINKFNDKLAYWVSEPDNGAANALNKGFEKASGDWFFYLNSDDVLLPGAIKKVLGFIKQKPGFDIYYGNGFSTDKELNNRKKVYSDLWNLDMFWYSKCMIFQHSTFIRGNFYRKHLSFNEKNTTCWDGEILVDAAIKGARFNRHPIFTALFRVHEDSITGSQKRRDKYLKDRRDIQKKITNYTGKKYEDSNWNIYLSKLMRDPSVQLKRLRQDVRFAFK